MCRSLGSMSRFDRLRQRPEEPIDLVIAERQTRLILAGQRRQRGCGRGRIRVTSITSSHRLASAAGELDRLSQRLEPLRQCCVTDVVPGAEVAGPADELVEDIKALHRAHAAKTR